MKRHSFTLLVALVTTLTTAAETTFSVTTDSVGQLAQLLPDSTRQQLTTLKVSGPLNGADLKLLQIMTVTQKPSRRDTTTIVSGHLTSLDLSQASIRRDKAPGMATRDNELPANLFAGATQLEDCLLPLQLQVVGNGAFAGCISLKTIELPKTLTRIGSHAFDGCAALQTNTIPAKVKHIGSDAFRGCANLDSIAVLGLIDEVEDDVFRQCHSLRVVTLPMTVKEIGDNAFDECLSLVTINMPVSLTEIGDAAFRKCVLLEKIQLPAGVKKIGDAAFRECTSLATATLSVSLKQIGSSAFARCPSLTEVNIKSPVAPKISSNTFKDVVKGACIFYIPSGSRPLYEADKRWSKIPQIIEKQKLP